MTQKDLAYRKALGIKAGTPLPKLLGCVQRNTTRVKRPRAQVFR